MAYQFAPRWSSGKLDDAFDFKSDRYKKVRNQINEDFKKNKKHLASLLLTLIDEAEAIGRKTNPSTGDFQNFFNSILKSRKAAVSLFRSSAEVILKDLTEDEKNNLQEYTEEKVSEQEEKLQKKESYLKKQMKSFDRVMDFLFDDSTKQQQEIYRSFLEANYEYFQSQPEVRRNFVKKFDSFMTDRPGLLNYVLSYYAGDSELRTEDQQKKLADFQARLVQVQHHIWTTLNEKQKKNFFDNLSNLRKDTIEFSNK